MSVKLLTEHCLEFLSLKGGCTGSSESTLVKMPQCWTCHGSYHTEDLTSRVEFSCLELYDKTNFCFVFTEIEVE